LLGRRDQYWVLVKKEEDLLNFLRNGSEYSEDFLIVKEIPHLIFLRRIP
jgi:hypothetical protein